jgi:hypothetical protein
VVNGFTPTCAFSSTGLVQDPRSEDAAVCPKNSIVDTERSQSIHQRPNLEESQRKASSLPTSTKLRPHPPPNLTIPELVHALGITGVHTFGRLSFRTAKRILYGLKKKFDEQRNQYLAVMSVCRRRAFRNTQVIAGPPGTMKGKSLIRRVSVEERGEHWREQSEITNKRKITISKEHTSIAKGNTNENKQNKVKTSSKRQNAKASPIRKLAITTEHNPEALSKTFRILAFQVSRLIEEAGAAIVSTRLRRLSTELLPRQPRSRSSLPRRVLSSHHRRARRLRASSRRSLIIKKIPYHSTIAGSGDEHTAPSQRGPQTQKLPVRPRVRRIRNPVRIKLHPTFVSGTIRYPNGARAKLKQRSRRHSTRSSPLARREGVRMVPRRVPVDWRPTDAALAVQRREEARRLRRQRKVEARRLASTVESWLGGKG